MAQRPCHGSAERRDDQPEELPDLRGCVMFQHVVVPIDDSTAAWRAVPIAARMAAAVDGKLDVVTVVDRVAAVGAVLTNLRMGVDRLGELAVEPSIEVLAHDSIVDAVGEYVEERNGAMIVMSSHGHGRSAAVVGSVTDEVLRTLFGPIVVIGPHVGEDAGRLDGSYVIPLDGSEHGDMIIPIASAWAIEFHAEPWLVEVIKPTTNTPSDFMDSAYAARHARKMQHEIGREVEFEVFRHDDPAKAIDDFARRIDASLLFATTHGRSGMSRLRAGSVAANLVRNAPCPIVLFRPPHLAED
jgi:nucleotide-binding universal stress UspA family protein